MYIDIFFHNFCPLFLSIHKYMYEYTKNNNTCMFSLFQHFVYSLSLLFFEKNIFFCFLGVYFVFLFFFNFCTCVGVKQSKIQKTMQEINFFFSRIKMSFVNTMNNVRRSLCKLGL